jgi:hypothetical protein
MCQDLKPVIPAKAGMTELQETTELENEGITMS